MISTIFNELIVQIVSDFFPKPKAPPGFTMSTTVHKPSPSFPILHLTSITVHKHKTNRHFLFLPFIQACLQANTNIKLTGIFCSFLLSKPAFKQTKANNNYSKTQSKSKAKQIKTNTSRSSLAEEEMASRDRRPDASQSPTSAPAAGPDLSTTSTTLTTP